MTFYEKDKAMKFLNYETGRRNPLFVIAGPCVIEDEYSCMEIASQMT